MDTALPFFPPISTVGETKVALLNRKMLAEYNRLNPEVQAYLTEIQRKLGKSWQVVNFYPKMYNRYPHGKCVHAGCWRLTKNEELLPSNSNLLYIQLIVRIDGLPNELVVRMPLLFGNSHEEGCEFSIHPEVQVLKYTIKRILKENACRLKKLGIRL